MSELATNPEQRERLTGEKVYVSGRLQEGEGSVHDLCQQVEALGHEVTLDWTTLDPVHKPYLDHAHEARPAAIQMREAAREASVFVLFMHPRLWGALIELGINIGAADSEYEKAIFVVGDSEEMRQSIFFALPNIQMVESADEVLEFLKEI